MRVSVTERPCCSCCSHPVSSLALQRHTHRPRHDQLRRFFDRYGPSARDAYRYAAVPRIYDELLDRRVREMTLETICRTLRLETSLMEDDSYTVFLIQPTTKRSLRSISLTSPAAMEKLCIHLKAKWQDFVADWYSRFLELPSTRASAGYILEAQVHRKMKYGGRFEAREMLERTGTVNKPFEVNPHGSQWTHAYAPTQAMYYDPGLRISESGYYIPKLRSDRTFDSFLYDSVTKTAILIQVTVGTRHSVNLLGLQEVKEMFPKTTSLTYLALVPSGSELVCDVPKSFQVPMPMFSLSLTLEDVLDI